MNPKLFWLLLLVLLGGVGYYIWSQIPDTPKDQTLGGYAENLHADEQRAQAVASSVNHSSVDEAIRKYKSDKGNLPASLQDLIPDYLDHVPGGLQYDSSTGTVSPAQ
jgi:hypothetical protein